MNDLSHCDPYPDENEYIEYLLSEITWSDEFSKLVEGKSQDIIRSIRTNKKTNSQLESFLKQYPLNTEEGLALMCIAEALLRIPDKETRDLFIKEKIGNGNWIDSIINSNSLSVKVAGIGLLLTRKTLDSVFSKLGTPVIREAILQAMNVMGGQFVIGENIANAIKQSRKKESDGYRYSYDILGEGARTKKDAERYFEAYLNALKKIAESKKPDTRTPGLSVKLSALHPRYETAQKEICVSVLTEKLKILIEIARDHDLTLTVDAEESERLVISIEIIKRIVEGNILRGWQGFGLAVQAYQKRALKVIDTVADLAKNNDSVVQIRLVKGAYWDSEIKHAQILGLKDFPVFTQKENTDLSYLLCAQKMFEYSDYIFPLFGTHNAHTAVSIIEMSKKNGKDFELQKLHGMGDALYNILLQQYKPKLSVYAPVGPYKDLLPYLVRRLLENGANTSFVNQLMDSSVPAEEIANDPVSKIRTQSTHRHPNIHLPINIYRKENPGGRQNSTGVNLQEPAHTKPLLDDIHFYANKTWEAITEHSTATPTAIINPANKKDIVGHVNWTKITAAKSILENAENGFLKWSKTQAEKRAKILESFADLLEQNTGELIALCIREAGKTIPDAVAEIREAVDFCRYYPNKGRKDFGENITLSGPTGEKNIYMLEGRGVFVCISPWNFPLAIFTGQIAAALMAGNSVVAKPAEQTPLIAKFAIELLHKAGTPKNVLHYAPGDGSVGQALIKELKHGGVVFTGSNTVAKHIQRSLAEKDGPILPLIAETGGQNTMIVDSTALAEQVIDDVIKSAFGSAGQRCSALRILCVQEDVKDNIMELLEGATKLLATDNPSDISSDIGPIIDQEAHEKLQSYIKTMTNKDRLLFKGKTPDSDLGYFLEPHVFSIDSLDEMKEEIFGPVLHVLSYKKNELEKLVSNINKMEYGLTFGLHTRLESIQESLMKEVNAGNIYINRSMIGAVVGTQPFGGHGLSGTGPKAGGPLYLKQFAQEKVISINTTAIGGNTSLVTL